MKHSGLENHLEEVLTIKGTAKNAKGYAVLLTEEKAVIYIKKLPEWSEEILDTQMNVKGTLKKMKLIPNPIIDQNGAISQGAQGLQYVLTNYEIIRSSD